MLLKKHLVSGWWEHQANWFLVDFVRQYCFQGQYYYHPLIWRILESFLESPGYCCMLFICVGLITSIYVWVILWGIDLHCISLVWIHTVMLDMLLQFGQFIEMLLTLEHKVEEYVCCIPRDVWMFCTLWDVASLRCLKLVSMMDLKESKWEWRSSTSSGKL